ncbi:venom protease-like [Palaemon carinicauda]|uniref:venom protease-like n=1 Tax=Palaemon carinicauda TaxID=392227 RepID=UPI0035B6697B
MRIGIFLITLSLVAAQDIVFPDGTEGNAGTTSNRLAELLGVNVRNGLPPNSTPAAGSNDCTTPLQERGTCGPINQCQSFIPLLRQLGDTSTLSFLRGRICRLLPRTIHFCCPSSAPSTVGSSSGPIEIPDENECGVPSVERVIGGKEAEIGLWPWVVAIGRPMPNNVFASVCGGSLITRRHVLSAAHCSVVDQVPEEVRTHVRVGEHNLRSDSDGLRPQDIKIASRRTNGYDAFTKANDIELLILEEDAIFHDFVKPVCLPIDPALRDNMFVNENATVVGWGVFSFESAVPRSSDVLMEADVPIVPLAPCSEVYRTQTFGTVVDETNICAGQGTTDACGGDSGGPLSYSNPSNERYYVIGIVSHGVGCATSEFPGVYTRVGAFMDWIVNNIRTTVV